MLERFSNFHTHTVLCDGKDEPEELVQRALELGCPAIGFSGHSYAPYDEDYCMSPAQTEEYKTEIRRLQRVYAGRIRIYMGVEQDFYSPGSTAEYDYIIGSVHYLYKDGFYLPVDASRQRQEQAVRDFYGGGMPRSRRTISSALRSRPPPRTSPSLYCENVIVRPVSGAPAARWWGTSTW